QRPLVVTVHDVAPALFPDAFPLRGRRFHERALAAVAERADLVVTVSHAAAEEIVAHSAVDAGRIRVVPHGVRPVAVDADARRGVLARMGIGEDRPYVLWVGSLEPRKGVPTLLAAMSALRRRRPHPPFTDALVVLAGYDGWLAADALTAEDRRGLEPVLRQLGRVSEQDLHALYAGAALFAFPSRHEGFGLPVLEAMSHGVPVVASDIPSLREVSGGAARLVEPGDVGAWTDVLEELLGDGAERDRLAEAGRRRSAGMTVEDSMRRLHDVYLEALAGAR
ncbi:MAG TPA: glycosyltransferase family 1 protein, partial [Acidimicrobiales bacterium]|nr:glycosyltransferase family 1 protein [Acidimicrobiales bacterium]